MECNVSELVKRGHDQAAELKASCGAVDVRTVAQLISDLATQLDVQLARSNALAAENGILLAIMNEQAGSFGAALAEGFHDAVMESGSDQLIDIYQRRLQPAIQCIPPTPDTDAFLAEVRAQGVEMFAEVLKTRGAAYQREFYADTGNAYIEASKDAEEFASHLRKGVQS
ncbi:hypothetical protein RN615_002483 [Escherichia coli]|nr:hypothetical protein [Escherichia coli]